MRRITAGAAMQGRTGAVLCQWFLGVGLSHSRRRASAPVMWAEVLGSYRFGVGAELN